MTGENTDQFNVQLAPTVLQSFKNTVMGISSRATSHGRIDSVNASMWGSAMPTQNDNDEAERIEYDPSSPDANAVRASKMLRMSASVHQISQSLAGASSVEELQTIMAQITSMKESILKESDLILRPVTTRS